MLEKKIEKYLVEKVKAMGGECRKVQWVAHRGAPDRLVMLPYRKDFLPGSVIEPSAIWIELKAPGEKPKPHQLREHERMRAMGQRVEVVDSFERVDEVLR